MKRCSIPYLIREIQIKTTRYHYIPIRTAKIQNSDTTKRWQECGATGTFIQHWWKCKMVQSFWETGWRFLIELNILLPYPIIVLLDVYPKELKTYVYTKTCTQMFIAALFIIAKILKQPRCPSVGKWIKKLWCIQLMKYYSVLKRNELSSYEKTW